MNIICNLLFSCFVLPMAGGWNTISSEWTEEKHGLYNLYYMESDRNYRDQYLAMTDTGIRHVQIFFLSPFMKNFNVYVHPDRHSLDLQWQKDWNMPEFKSECWMVASGVASKLDLLSPRKWKEESCEHDFSEKVKSQQLIMHELIHVFHGQWNVSPDFSDVSGMDWFVEGLATYASGQCDSSRMEAVKKAVMEKTVKKSLDTFWMGKLKYGLSGSVVMYMDAVYGRNKLKELLKFNKKEEALSSLGISEEALLNEWEKYILRY